MNGNCISLLLYISLEQHSASSRKDNVLSQLKYIRTWEDWDDMSVVSRIGEWKKN